MVEYIEREALLKKFYTDTRFGFYGDFTDGSETAYTSAEVNAIIVNAPAVDVVEIVRCKDCKYAIELDKHCEINRSAYKHCVLLRGDETKYVWHKYKKYYKDYSIVEPDDFCSCGERKGDNG